MNIYVFRHWAATSFMLVASRIARVIHGPLNPEKLYSKTPVMEQRIARAPRNKSVRPTNSRMSEMDEPDSPAVNAFEAWLTEDPTVN
jgi:hypothetical protein